MLAFAQALAVVGYLTPLAIWWSLRAAMARPPAGAGAAVSPAADIAWAVEIGVAVAVDLLTVLLLARLFTLERATLVSRAAWVIGGGAFWIRRYRRGWRRTWSVAELARRAWPLALAAGTGLLLSVQLSRPCAVWDREWHIPLVSSLRGQRMPFMNVYDPLGRLAYHYIGDVQAAMLQALSGSRLHASLALSLAHDVMFALLALNVMLFVRRLGIRRATLALLIFGATVMLGPVTLLRDDTRKLDSGFGVVNLLTLSYRPHVPLAYLLELAWVQLLFSAPASLGARLGDWRGRALCAAALAAALALSDEASLGVIGLATGVLWLFQPAALAPTRKAGMVVFGGLAAAIVLAVTLFGGSFSPGAPKYNVRWVAPRAPGYALPAVSLATEQGRSLLFQDLLPVLGVAAGLVVLALRSRDRATVGATIFLLALTLVSAVLFSCLEYEGRAPESHRFVTAIFVLAPLLATVALDQVAQRAGGLARLAGPASLLVVASLGLGVASTVEWLGSGVALRQCRGLAFADWRARPLFDTDCRAETGTRLGQVTTQAYVDPQAFYSWAGCRSVFAPAASLGAHEHHVKTHGPFFGLPAFEQLRQAAPAPSDVVSVVCVDDPRAAVPNPDPICRRVKDVTARCTPTIDVLRECLLDGPARDLLAQRARL